MTKTPKNPTPSTTLETPETDRLVGSNPTDGLAPAISPVYLAESRRSRRTDESRPKLDKNSPRDAREMPPTLDDPKPQNDADAELRHDTDAAGYLRSLVDDHAPGAWASGRVTLAGDVAIVWSAPVDPPPVPLLRARVRSGTREYARGSEWVTLPSHGDLRSDHALLPGELTLTLEEARTPDPESDAVMRADARALACARDFGDAWNMAADAGEAEATARLVQRCLTRWQRALVAADRAAAPR